MSYGPCEIVLNLGYCPCPIFCFDLLPLYAKIKNMSKKKTCGAFNLHLGCLAAILDFFFWPTHFLRLYPRDYPCTKFVASITKWTIHPFFLVSKPTIFLKHLLVWLFYSWFSNKFLVLHQSPYHRKNNDYSLDNWWEFYHNYEN